MREQQALLRWSAWNGPPVPAARRRSGLPGFAIGRLFAQRFGGMGRHIGQN
ncbi:MAG: hypothetical protein WA817_02275 [Candidatus Acidiferrum sp.]